MEVMSPRPSPFSVRLEPGLDARITAMAKRLRRSKASVLKSLADEAERTRRHPGIWFMGDEDRRRAALAGTRWKLYLLIPMLRGREKDLSAVVEEFGPGLTVEQCRAALAYYREFPTEIDEEIAYASRPIEEWQQEFPDFESVVVEG